MARFGSGGSGGDGEENEPFEVPVEDDLKVDLLPKDPEESAGKSRRILVLVVVGVVLIAGAYLANRLFLAPAPELVAPPRPAPLASALPPAPPVGAGPQTPAPQPPAPPSAPRSAGPPSAAPLAPAPPATPAKVPEAKTSAPAPAKSSEPAKPAAAPPPAAKVSPLAPPKSTPAAKAAAKAETPAAGGAFSLQLGAMSVAENADALRKRLEASGFAATVSRGAGQLRKHVVTIGDAVGRAEAEAVARRLNVDGFPSQIVAVDGKYAPQIGAFSSLDEAIDLAREVQKKQYRPKITLRPTTGELYHVRHGSFDSRAAAMKRGEELKAKGFSVLVVHE